MQVLSELNWWTLIFSQVFTFSEVWGIRPGGLTIWDQRETELAWDEHHRMTEAEKAVDKLKEKQREAKDFDRVAYLMKRKAVLEAN